MTDLAKTKLGDAELSATFEDKMIKLSATYAVPGVSVGATISIDPSLVLDAAAKAIPGAADDVVFGLIKGAFLK
jgi:hypothetical protein